MNNVNIGIIGIGNMGSAHLSCLTKGEVENLNVVAVCDIDNEKLEKALELCPTLKTFTSASELIKSGVVDAVLISVPHRFHVDYSIMALENGLNVMCEKPIDITFSKAKKLNDVAKKSDKVFGIMFNQRTNPIYQKAREIFKSGQIGEMQSMRWEVTNWYRTQEYYDSSAWRGTWAGEGGGVLLNQAPHNLDLMQWICSMPVSLNASCFEGKFHEVETEDEANIYMTFANGAKGEFITTTGNPNGINHFEILGSEGKLIIENAELEFIDKNGNSQVFKQDEEVNGHRAILQNFTNAIISGETLIAKGEEGINQLTLTNAAYLSSWKNGAQIDIPLCGEDFDVLLGEKAAKSSFDKNEQKQNCEFNTDGYSERWTKVF